MIALLAWAFIIENLLFGLAPSVGRYGPVHAGNAMVGGTTRHLLSPAEGTAMLIAWTAALCAAGMVLNARRDVS